MSTAAIELTASSIPLSSVLVFGIAGTAIVWSTASLRRHARARHVAEDDPVPSLWEGDDP